MSAANNSLFVELGPDSAKFFPSTILIGTRGCRIDMKDRTNVLCTLIRMAKLYQPSDLTQGFRYADDD